MKKSKNENKNEFTLLMSITDFLPVALFCVFGIIVFLRIYDPIFLTGVLITTSAGFCKALWKLIACKTEKDISALTKLFHIFMPFGFATMLVSIPFSLKSWNNLVHSLFQIPSFIFIIAGFVCMALMVIFALKLDFKKSSSNWIEQLTNTAAQAFFVIALLIA